MLDFRIGTFLKLCETKSYTNTAKILHITQPSVTQHIKYLQKRYQCKLFTYEGKTLRLTPEGEYLRRQAEAISKTSSKVMEDLKRMSCQQNVLRFGCPTALGDAVVPQIIGMMMADNKDLEIQFCTANTETLLKMLENGKVDFILADKRNAKQNFGTYNVGKSKFCGWASPDLATELYGLSLKRIFHEKLLLREEGSGSRAMLEQALADKNFSVADFYSVMECNSPSSIQALTAANAGITFALECCMKDAARQNLIQKLCLSDFSVESKLEFMYLKDSLCQESCKAFFEPFKELWIQKQQEEA